MLTVLVVQFFKKNSLFINLMTMVKKIELLLFLFKKDLI
jgi:hypothetical protein